LPREAARGSVSPFTTRIEFRNGVASIALVGDLDIATLPVLQADLARVEGDGAEAIMLDLRELAFLDSSGLQAVLSAKSRARANGHRFILIGASPNARRLFELTRTEFLLDEDEAVSLLDQFTGSRARRAALGQPGGGSVKVPERREQEPDDEPPGSLRQERMVPWSS
jgi:anti-anti-sigma factor